MGDPGSGVGSRQLFLKFGPKKGVNRRIFSRRIHPRCPSKNNSIQKSCGHFFHLCLEIPKKRKNDPRGGLPFFSGPPKFWCNFASPQICLVKNSVLLLFRKSPMQFLGPFSKKKSFPQKKEFLHLGPGAPHAPCF